MIKSNINISCYKKAQRRRKTFLSALKCYIIKLLVNNKKGSDRKKQQTASFIS